MTPASSVSFFSRALASLNSVTSLLSGFIADRWGIITAAFYFLADTVFVADLIVMAICEDGNESAALVQEPA